MQLITLETLYSFGNSYSLEAHSIHHNDYTDSDDSVDLDITLRGFGGADCQIGNFAKNFYFRTPGGINYKKYKSYKTLVNAVIKTSRTNGFEIQDIFINFYDWTDSRKDKFIVWSKKDGFNKLIK